MSDQRWIWTSEQQIPSISGAHRPLVELVRRQLEAHAWGEHDVFAVQLALVEALVNAMKHGNRYDATKTVTVACILSDDCIHIEIADEGDGFDPEEVPDPTREENLDLPSGRGIMLIRSFMTGVTFNEVGNRVVMEKHREAAPDL